LKRGYFNHLRKTFSFSIPKCLVISRYVFYNKIKKELSWVNANEFVPLVDEK